MHESQYESRKEPLSQADSFAKRLWAYFQERFPLGSHGILIVSYYSSNQFLAQVLTQPDQPLSYNLGSLLGAITLLCLFFHLRVFDEHKDYEEDCRHYPDRVLQRGLVTLGQLRTFGFTAILLELIISWCWQPSGTLGPFVAVVIALGYSILMRYEFFVPDWLRKRFLLYTISHMLIMPLFALVVFSFATGRYPWQASTWFWVYSWVGFFVTLNWEISRKIRAPDDEITGVDSYSQLFGPFGASYLVLLVRAVDTLLVWLVGQHLGLSGWFTMALIVLYLVCVLGFIQFRMHTTRANAKRLETYAGMYIIAFDALLAFELGRRQGVVWEWWPQLGMS
jgi:4-hydroxybenzoate polyprenyltransferase